MKKFLFLLLLLPSCQKEYCWECEISTRTGMSPMPINIITSKVEYCNKTENEINQIIDQAHHNGNNYSSAMTCTKKQ